MAEKIYKFAVIALALGAIAYFGAGSITQAHDNCSNGLSGYIISVGGNGNPAIASVTNNSDCSSEEVSFTSYKMYVQQGQPNWLTSQVFYDSQTITLSPGGTQQISISVPNCQYQLDLYSGGAITQLTAYGTPDLIDYAFSGSPLCNNNPPPPPQLTCSPATQNVNVGTYASFSASGGTGVYSWSGGESPMTGSGYSFSTSFNSSGTKTVIVTSGTQSAQCQVNVNQVAPPQLTCSPATQNVNVGTYASFSASGGTGVYSWSGGESPMTGSGYSFSTSFNSSGTKTVIVTSGTQSAQCQVNVNQVAPPQLTCSPATQNVNVGTYASFSASGGTGVYSWSSPGSPSSGSGANFNSSFSTPGAQTVSVSDGAHTANCSVIVNQPTSATLICSPAIQTGNVGATINFSASGGNGSYSWNTGDGSPVSGSGSAFSTSFATAGTKTVTVTSGSQTATCSATIAQTTCNLSQTWLTATTNVGQNSATLNGYVDPQGQSATYYFQYGSSYGYGNTTAEQTISSAQSVSATISGLQPNTLYYFHLVVQSACGTNQTQASTFQTPGDPTPPYTPPYYPPTYNPPYYPPTYNPPYYPTYTPPVTCGPQYQNVNVGAWVAFNVSGGSGSYSWFTSSDAYPTTGGGSEFGTRFSTAGSKTVTVSAVNGGSAQCSVNVVAAPIVYPPQGQVLGAADIVTGPEDTWPLALGLGFLSAVFAYYFYFEKRLAVKNSGLPIRIVENTPELEKPTHKTELETILEKIKAAENIPDA